MASRISKSNVVHCRMPNGAELLFRSGMVAKVDVFKRQVTLNMGNFQTPAALVHVNSFLDRHNILATVKRIKDTLFLVRPNGMQTIEPQHVIEMTGNEVANAS